MYLFNLKIFLFAQTLASSSFNKSCIATCNAVNSDCILKELVTSSVRGLFTNTKSLTGDTMNSKLIIMHSLRYCIIQIFRLLCRQGVGVFVNKPLTSTH